MFRGSQALLAQRKPTLLFECHDDEADRGELFEFLSSQGYDGYFFHVSRAVHASLRHKGRGRFIPADQRASYPHVHPAVRHRNIIFVAHSTQP